MCDIDLGVLGEKAWWEVPLPPCPDCGGDIIWWEAGYAPGTRICVGKPVEIVEDKLYQDGKRRSYKEENGCGAMFSINVEKKQDGLHVTLHRLEVKGGILR